MAQEYIQGHQMTLVKAQKKEKLLELEPKKLSEALQILRAYSEGGDVEAKKVESLEENLMEKEENLEHHDCLNQALLIKVGQSNDELLDARKELINVLEEVIGQENDNIEAIENEWDDEA